MSCCIVILPMRIMTHAAMPHPHSQPEADCAKESSNTKVSDCGLFCQSRMIPARLGGTAAVIRSLLGDEDPRKNVVEVVCLNGLV